MNDVDRGDFEALDPREAPPTARQDQSETLNDLAAALAKAQGKIRSALKDSENPHFKSTYATLAAIWDACRKQLAEHGLSVIQRGKITPNGYIMRTRLLHDSGQWIEGEVPCITSGRQQQQEMQALGSAITYARRYGLAAIVGVAPEEDDDAEGTERRKPQGEEPVIGKYKKTELKERLRAFDGDLHACEDTAMLAGVQESYKDVLEQCERDLPSWWYGAQGSDAPGIAERITRVQNQLRVKEQTILDAG